MDYSNIGLFGMMKTKLNYLSAEQSALAQNVANADTPGYKAMDVPAPDFKKMAAAAHKLLMTTTNAKHMTGAKNASDFKVEKRHDTQELNPNGNNVVVEEEIAKAGQNQMEYQKVLNLYGKAISMFKVAIGNTNPEDE